MIIQSNLKIGLIHHIHIGLSADFILKSGENKVNL